ncbi:unnamed protein product [Camellia sinensis]
MSPHYIIIFFSRNGVTGWTLLGAIFLCITGAEAMFADLGHFNKNSIQAFGGDDSDVGSPRINLTATAKSNPPVDSQSLRESDIQLNMFLLDFILLFYFF